MATQHLVLHEGGRGNVLGRTEFAEMLGGIEWRLCADAVRLGSIDCSCF